MDRGPNDGALDCRRGWHKDDCAGRRGGWQRDTFAEHDGLWLGTECGVKGETTADE